MRKSKYLVLNNFYFNFNDDLTEIKEIKVLFKKQNIIDLERFNKINKISNYIFENMYINFAFLPNEIFKIENLSFLGSDLLYINFLNLLQLKKIDNMSIGSNKLNILDLSNCSLLEEILFAAFSNNQIKKLKLPKNIKYIGEKAFSNNQIKILDISNCLYLKKIENGVFLENKIQYLKLNKTIEIIEEEVFKSNNIEYLDLSSYKYLNKINNLAFSRNPLQEIKILDNINVGTSYSPSFETDKWNTFTKYYNDNNKKAGDYKLENNKWKWYPL